MQADGKRSTSQKLTLHYVRRYSIALIANFVLVGWIIVWEVDLLK